MVAAGTARWLLSPLNVPERALGQAWRAFLLKTAKVLEKYPV